MPVWHWLCEPTEELDQQVDAIERELTHIQRVDRMARLLSSIPGIGLHNRHGPRCDRAGPAMLRSGREFAAWLGLTPKQNSKASSQACRRA